MRLKSQAEKQAERCQQSPGHYNRKLARRKWREHFAEGTFMYRKLLPSCPGFQEFKLSP